MKKLLLLTTILTSGFIFQSAKAQVSISINIGNQPVWGPAGYDYAQFYYFPDIDIYYDVTRQEFVYYNGFNWVYSFALPPQFGSYDLYGAYKVVVNEPNPFMRHSYWRSRYTNFRAPYQPIIFHSREPRYFVINNHPEHNRWVSANRNRHTGSFNNRPDNFPNRNSGYNQGTNRPQPGNNRNETDRNNGRNSNFPARNNVDNSDRFGRAGSAGNNNDRSDRTDRNGEQGRNTTRIERPANNERTVRNNADIRTGQQTRPSATQPRSRRN